jgi:hypothetical protein
MFTRRFALTGLAILLASTVLLAGGAMKSDLAPPEGAADLDAKGFVKIKAHKKTGDLHLFEVKITKVDKDVTYGVFVEEPAESGLFEQIGGIQVKGKQKDPDNHKGGGAGKLKINTQRKQGKAAGGGLGYQKGKLNSLWLGGVEVTAVETLYGRSVEVRDAEGAVVLEGTVPAPEVTAEE